MGESLPSSFMDDVSPVPLWAKVHPEALLGKVHPVAL